MPEPRGPQHGQQMPEDEKPENRKPGQQDTRANIDQETPKPSGPGGQERYAESKGKDKQDHQPDRKQSQEQAAQMRQVDQPGRVRE